jgi:cytochrome c oxidase subunit 2
VGLKLPKRAQRIGTWTVVSTSLLLLGACAVEDREQVGRVAMPEPATDRAVFIYDLWIWSWVAAMLVGILVWGLILYAAFRYRRRSDDEIPVQTRYNLPIEILYTVAPVVMVLVFFYFTVDTQNTVREPVDDPDHELSVVGQQWSWTFNYLDEEAVQGDDVYTVGTTADLPTLVLPVDESVTIHLSSPDVIHSFWVPAFLEKLDVIPGRANELSFTPTREGTFAGNCAELCGVYHSRMLFNVEVVSADEFAEHLQELKELGNVGEPEGGEDAREPAGLGEEGGTEENGESE